MVSDHATSISFELLRSELGRIAVPGMVNSLRPRRAMYGDDPVMVSGTPDRAAPSWAAVLRPLVLDRQPAVQSRQHRDSRTGIGNSSRLRGRVGLQSKFRAWLPLCERPDGP